MDFAALFSVQLHFLFHQREDQNLLILIEHSISAHIEHFKELVWIIESKQVVYILALGLKDQPNVGLIQKTLFPEVSFLDCQPDFSCFASATK